MADMLIRQITAQQALENTLSMWECVKYLCENEGMVTQGMYMEILRYTARRILVKLESTGLDVDTWKTYTDFFMQAILGGGTSNSHFYLCTAEQLMHAVLTFPTSPVPLVEEYVRCVSAQMTQRQKELAGHESAPSPDTFPVPQPIPDLDYDDTAVACIVEHPLKEVMEMLKDLPKQLTFAKRHAVMRLKLSNPLHIPQCAFVLGGYSCDTCRLRDIHVSYQAMVYDDGEGESPEINCNVRSEAHISGKSYGFDMCMACVVFFYAQQQENLRGLILPPHVTYALGQSAGVQVFSARYCTRSCWHAVQYDCTHLDCRSIPTTSPPRPTSSDSSCSNGEEKSSPVGSSGETIVYRSRSLDVGTDALVTTHSVFERPPVRPPTRRISDSVTEAPPPPATRCVAYQGAVISLSLSLAPYGARPIVWVLRGTEKLADKRDVDEMLWERLGPDSNWRSRVTIRLGTMIPLSSASLKKGSHWTSEKHCCADAANSGATDDLGTCAICLYPFESETPTIGMKCSHWFHVSCITEYTLTSGDVCPLCRTPEVLPDMSRATTLEKNMFSVEVTLTEAERLYPHIDVCVGALITRDGNYRNATSIAAAQCVRLYPPK